MDRFFSVAEFIISSCNRSFERLSLVFDTETELDGGNEVVFDRDYGSMTRKLNQARPCIQRSFHHRQKQESNLSGLLASGLSFFGPNCPLIVRNFVIFMENWINTSLKLMKF